MSKKNVLNTHGQAVVEMFVMFIKIAIFQMAFARTHHKLVKLTNTLFKQLRHLDDSKHIC